jgi:ABC-type Fe3+/spermidine/putrescine transport system ATPase subunit
MDTLSETGIYPQLIAVKQLSKQFPGRLNPAIRQVSFELKAGELGALVGGSGSGKTTLLRMLAGLEQPDSGAILFRGKAVKGPDEQLVAGHPNIRLVHQHFELAHRQSVYQNVAQKLRHLPAAGQEARSFEILGVCRLHQLSAKKVEELSGGEKQRLAIARALAEEPELLLLDEPFSNLDPVLKEEIKEEVFSYIRQQGIAAILVSHDPKDALSLADKLWVMQNGELVQAGSPKAVYYKAVSPAVAGLFGKMNVCTKENLAPFLKGEAGAFMQAIPEGSLLGFRPEALQPVNGSGAHLKGKVQETAFHGPLTEVKVNLGDSVSLVAYLPSFSAANPNDNLGFNLQLEQVQVWRKVQADSA